MAAGRAWLAQGRVIGDCKQRNCTWHPWCLLSGHAGACVASISAAQKSCAVLALTHACMHACMQTRQAIATDASNHAMQQHTTTRACVVVTQAARVAALSCCSCRRPLPRSHKLPSTHHANMMSSTARSAALWRRQHWHFERPTPLLAQARPAHLRQPAARCASPQKQPSQQQQQPEEQAQQQQQQAQQQPATGWQQQLAQRWDTLSGLQRGYAVLVGLLALAALPRALTLAVLLLERVVVGALLATEELLLELLLKGGALLGALAVVGVLVSGVILFSRKEHS